MVAKAIYKNVYKYSSNNATIITELAVGGGLAILFFILQHRSTRRINKIWSNRQDSLYWSINGDLRDIQWFSNKTKNRVSFINEELNQEDSIFMNAIHSLINSRLSSISKKINNEKDVVDQEVKDTFDTLDIMWSHVIAYRSKYVKEKIDNSLKYIDSLYGVVLKKYAPIQNSAVDNALELVLSQQIETEEEKFSK